MEYRTLGRTGLNVSVIGFGGAPIGLQGYLSPEDRDGDVFQARAGASIRAAVDGGINYFDTAPGYGDGRGERLLGAALEGRRDRVLLATKYPFDAAESLDERTQGVRGSLERLRTDYVDVLQLHGGVFDDALAEQIIHSGVLNWADDLRARGLCRWTGITAEGPSGALERLLRTGRFDVLEMNYNLIYQAACDYQRAPRTGIIPLARSLGMGVTTMRPTTCGFLQKLLAAEFPGMDTDRLTRLAIRFVLSTPEVNCVVVGMRSADEVAANLALADDAAARLDLTGLHNRYE